MDDKTHALLTQLADKLGTTAEQLWGILIRQAPIYAVTNLIEAGVMVVVLWLAGKFLLKKLRTLPDEDSEIAVPIALIFGIVWALTAGFSSILIVSEFSNIATALLHPEFWALEQILNQF